MPLYIPHCATPTRACGNGMRARDLTEGTDVAETPESQTSRFSRMPSDHQFPTTKPSHLHATLYIAHLVTCNNLGHPGLTISRANEVGLDSARCPLPYLPASAPR